MKLIYWLLLLINLLVLLGVTYTSKSSPKPTPQQPKQAVINVDSDLLFEVINDWRVENGYKRYLKHDSICEITDKRNKQILLNYSHDGLLDKSWEYPSLLSENLTATDGADPKIALNNWLASPTHHEALKRPYKYSCVSCIGYYCVQIFSNCENGCPSVK